MKPFQLTGKLSVIGETKTVGSNGFTIREFVLDQDKDSKYPNLIPFKLSKDNCEIVDGFKVGAHVTVSFYVNGRKWTDPKGIDKYFSSLDCVKIEQVADGGSVDCPPPAEPPDDIGEAVNDDIPF